MNLSPHFRAEEFQSRGRPFSDGGEARYRRLALETLEPLRAALQCAINVNCGERLPDHNRSVKGEPSSFHLPPSERASAHLRTETCAADIHCVGKTPGEVASVAAQLMRDGAIPMGGIGVYRTFVHIDNRGFKARWNGPGPNAGGACHEYAVQARWNG